MSNSLSERRSVIRHRIWLKLGSAPEEGLHCPSPTWPLCEMAQDRALLCHNLEVLLILVGLRGTRLCVGTLDAEEYLRHVNFFFLFSLPKVIIFFYDLEIN